MSAAGRDTQAGSALIEHGVPPDAQARPCVSKHTEYRKRQYRSRHDEEICEVFSFMDSGSGHHGTLKTAACAKKDAGGWRCCHDKNAGSDFFLPFNQVS